MSSYRALRLFAIAVLTVGVPSSVTGQSKASSSSSTGGNTTTPRPPAPRIPPPPGLSPLIILSGNVITEDGSPLPEPAYIERVCNGQVVRDGRTDFKGYFTITLGQFAPQLDYAEGSAETPGMGNSSPYGPTFSNPYGPISGGLQGTSTIQAMLSACELRASLAGFRSSSVGIPPGEVGGVGPVNVGTIVVQRMGEAQGVTVSATSLKAPKDAKKAYQKGHHAIENNKLPEAQRNLEKAVHLYPQYAAAWQDLGWVYAQQNQLEKARNAFEQARTADSSFVPAYVGLSSVALRQSQWAEAANFSAHAVQMDSLNFPVAFYYNSLANYRLGNLEQAERSARKAEMLGAQRTLPQVSLLMGVMLAKRRDYVDAANQLRSYLKAAPNASNAEKVRQQLAEVEKLAAAGAPSAAQPAK
jgi:Tfp pilus assembly protein PilF